MNEKEWIECVKVLLKNEIKRSGLKYQTIVDKINKIGGNETLGGFKNKMHRGTFSAVFMIQCLKVIGCDNINII